MTRVPPQPLALSHEGGCPLFGTDLPDGQLILPNVVLSQKHALGIFHLISYCDEPLHIHLRSDLSRTQLAFQLENANVEGDRINYENFNEVDCKITRQLTFADI